MKYPKTGSEVYVSLNLSNTMLTGIGKGTITREEVSASYLKRLFAEHGVIVSAKPEQRRLLEIVNERCDLELEIPEQLKLFQLSEEHRRLVVIEVTGLRRKNGSLLPEYTEEEFNEATFAFVKYYVQGTHYDTLVEENKKLKFEHAFAAVFHRFRVGDNVHVFGDGSSASYCRFRHKRNFRGAVGFFEKRPGGSVARDFPRFWSVNRENRVIFGGVFCISAFPQNFRAVC